MKLTTFLIFPLLQLATAIPLIKRTSQPGSVSVKWGAAGFLGEFTIGGQAIDLLIDTGSCGTWVVGPEASECRTQTHCYDPRDAPRVPSSTASGFKQTYNDGLEARGDTIVIDTFGSQKPIGGFQIEEQYVQVASDIKGDNGKPLWEEKNGLLGMCRAGRSRSSPKRLDTLPTTSGKFDYWTSYLKSDAEETWSLCFDCMADSSLYDSSSGLTVKSIDSKNWYVDSDGWAVTVTGSDGKPESTKFTADDKILLDTGATITALDNGSLKAIAAAYGGSCSGGRCSYPCYIKDGAFPDGSPRKQGVKVTLPWGTGSIPFEPRAFYRGSYSCGGGNCTCKFGLKTKEGALTYGSAVFKSAYFKWDVKNSEITTFRYR
ncbi:hypothetical protein TWF569_004622 [Orbilia oligospora]|uniref:Peptidase A1 domain-containing protein n=1 Tax=Orbilia oligospora TaxID=2813651 RepID=A0A7C8N3M5_ORBOL|nr:hypothetical protein TWF103_004765 [Orbilia oligospora]KAF3095817.1 hypothetical protein TWF102_006817 [Orbilia oligospora]KAF3118964.1 hypothetical protein TWF569_004622 [Orbilia oligospora]KAF3139111.1 hypothetical protein TWF594_006857 [Orbilia oligospora]